MNKIIFFGNGPLADAALAVLEQHCQILFHARTQDDLAEAVHIKQTNPEAFGVLASFGVIIKSDILDAFEPEGILNVHPSKLPLYRGPSPIESAILNGDTEFSYSIMKLVRAMDAGPIYHQDTLTLPLDKFKIYDILATSAASWLVDHFDEIRQLTPVPQDDSQATFTTKLDKSMSLLHPEQHTTEEILRQIIAYQGFPKPKADLFDRICIILRAHIATTGEESPLTLSCTDGQVIIDELQPEGKKPMPTQAFINGYVR